MLNDRLSPADEVARDKEMQEALAACPRILDLVARGPLADPDAEAVVYLRSPLDPNPVIVSNDRLMGCTKAAENFFRAQGIGKDDPVAVLLPICPAAIAAIWGAAACGIAEPVNLLFTREAIIAQLNAVKAKLLLAPPPGMPGGLYEKIEGLQKDVPSLQRIVVVPLDGTIAFDGEVLKPDPAWRDDYGKCRDASEAERVAVMLPTGGTTGHPKVARLTNRSMVASSVSSRMALDYRKGDRAMISLPLFHVGGLFVGVGACLSAGVTIVIPGPAGARDPALVTEFLERDREISPDACRQRADDAGRARRHTRRRLRHFEPARHADGRLDLPAGNRTPLSREMGRPLRPAGLRHDRACRRDHPRRRPA